MNKQIFMLRHPIAFTLVSLVATAIMGFLLAGLVKAPWLHMSFSAAITVVLAILLRKHLGTVLSLPPSRALGYVLPILTYMMLCPLLTGGYDFSLVNAQLVVYMMSVGIYEEVLVHGISMSLLITHYEGQRNSLVRAGVQSSILFGLLHLISILQNPSNAHWWAFKISTVCFAFLISMGFAGLVAATRSVWPAAILHGMLDVLALNVGNPAVLKSIQENWWITEGVVSIAVCLPLALYGVALLRKQQTLPAAEGASSVRAEA